MTGRISCKLRNLLLILLILFGFSRSAFSFQKILSGNINQPKTHVVTVSTDRVTVDDATGFAAGDTVMLIQMQGVRILTDATSAYGTLQNKYGEPGIHEFLIVLSVSSNVVVFRNDIKNTFNANGNVQLVRVPYYNSANVTGTLTCNPWDPVAKSGGVIAMIIGRTIKLNSNIDASGLGFRGGKDTIGLGIDWSSDQLLYGNSRYPWSFANAGYKGEGIAIHDDATGNLLLPSFAKGYGPNFNGGGGGNARYAGGGGGGNRGQGGNGGQENSPPYITFTSRGLAADHFSLPNRIYFGGGGGASTSFAGGTGSGGGNGGGIIIIIADTIIGNGGNILAIGSNGSSAVGGGGSGGGGAGGSIVLSVNSFGTAPISLNVIGGNGGDNSSGYSEGGGGSGGLVWISKNTTANVTVSLAGGNPGSYPSSTADPGDIGEKRTTTLFKPNLNGFLFNSIRSSVSNDQVDSICSNMIPRKITGTIPVGGSTPYTYLWEKSYDQTTWTPLVNDPDPLNYTPPAAETTTFYIRRTITDSSPTPLVDVSKSVKVIVQPYIKNNIVGNVDSILVSNTDTICYNQKRPVVRQLTPDLADGNGKYTFGWQDSTSSASWGTAISNLKNLSSSPIIKTTWYRRTVTSGRCIDSTAKVRITVLPLITSNNITSLPQDICFGMTFNNLVATTPSVLAGGDNSYRYKWIANINSLGWTDTVGVVNSAGYNPAERSERTPSNTYYYRRVVYSGNHNVCRDTSAAILLRDYPVLTGNTISANQTIGHDSIPAIFIGSLPSKGNGIYAFLWQYKTKLTGWSTVTGISNQQNYSPSVLTDTTWYRRMVTSSACSDTSNTIVVNVHKTIINNNIAFASGAIEDTICNGVIPLILKGTVPSGGTNIPGDYSMKWYYSTDNSSWIPVASGGAGQDYQPAALTVTTWFRRYVSSPASSPTSTSKGNAIKITVLPLISNYNIRKDTTVCFNTPPLQLQGLTLGGGDGTYGYTWQDSTSATGWQIISGATLATFQPPALISQSRYKRTVYSGTQNACSAVSNTVTININPLPTGSITSLTDTLCESTPLNFTLNLTGKSPWIVKYNENSTPVTISSVTSASSVISRTPSVSGSSAVFNYALTSVQDANLCFATSLGSGIRKTTLYKAPKSNAGNDTVLCGPTVTLRAIPSSGAGKWYDNVTLLGSAPVLKVTIDSLFPGGRTSRFFRWQEANWNCKDKDSVKISFDKRIRPQYTRPDTIFLYSVEPTAHMRADSLLSWEKGKWSLVSGTGDIENDTLYNTKVNHLSRGWNSLLLKIQNGTCKVDHISNIFSSLITIPRGFSPNGDTINSVFRIKDINLAYQKARLTIVNGAGVQVFSTSNENGQEWKNWDGRNTKGVDQPEGTYYYVLTVWGESDKEPHKVSGFIILKRF
jgi:gliding motility-associated-like protein